MSEHSAVGVTYSTDFMEGGSLTLGAGFEMAVDESGGDDPSAMRAGLNISVDQISFGGSMYDADGRRHAVRYRGLLDRGRDGAWRSSLATMTVKGPPWRHSI